MALELHGAVDVGGLLESASNAHSHVLVVRGPCPDGYPEECLTNRHDSSANLVLILKGLADAGKHGEKPNVVNFAHGLVAGQLDAPLSSALVGGILPHWLDSLLEKMVVGADGEVAGLHDVVVNTPKVLDGIKGDEFLERLLPVVGIGLLSGVVEPEGP